MDGLLNIHGFRVCTCRSDWPDMVIGGIVLNFVFHMVMRSKCRGGSPVIVTEQICMDGLLNIYGSRGVHV